MKHKNLKRTLALVCAAILFSSCDPEYFDELYFDNQSGYDILFEYSGNYRYYPSEYERGHDGTYPVPNKKKTLVFTDGGIGSSGKEESEWRIVYQLYGDSITFVIDSTHRITYYAHDSLSDDSPYNFKAKQSQYSYTEPQDNSYSTCHTYTITEEQIKNRLETQP